MMRRRTHTFLLIALASSAALAEPPPPNPPPNPTTPNAGHDKKFFLSDTPRDNRLNISGQLQFRYKATFQDDDPGVIGAGNDATVGFSMRRAKIKFDGSVVSERLKFKVIGAFSRSSGALILEDALMSYEINTDWTVRAGQFKAPFLREELVSSTSQLFVERSVVNETFNQDFSQGIELSYSNSRFRTTAMVSDGLASRNTPYNTPGEADIALTARAEALIIKADDWKRFKDLTSWRGGETNALLGGAIHWQTMGRTNPAGPDIDMLALTADASVEGDGWNTFASVVWRRMDTAAGMEFDDLGASVQGGVFVTDSTELIARWDAVFADSNRGGAGDVFNTISVGFNHYFVPESHAAKLTGSVRYSLDAVNDLAGVVRPSDSISLRPDANEGQIGLMIQMQLLF